MRACVTLDASSAAHSAYRDASIRPLCGVCRDATTAELECPRCKTPLCTEHATTAGARCGACEATYERLLDDRRRDPLPAWTVPVIYVVSAIGAALLVPYVAHATGSIALSAAVGLLVAFLPLFVGLYRRKRLRPTFLRETPQRRSLRVRRVFVPRPFEPRLPVCAWGVVAMITSLLFFIPLAPVLGIVFGGISISRHGKRDVTMGRTGLIVGIVMMCLQALVAGAVAITCW